MSLLIVCLIISLLFDTIFYSKFLYCLESRHENCKKINSSNFMSDKFYQNYSNCNYRNSMKKIKTFSIEKMDITNFDLGLTDVSIVWCFWVHLARIPQLNQLMFFNFAYFYSQVFLRNSSFYLYFFTNSKCFKF